MKVKIIIFFILFLVFLPFTQALTFNIGFPLKISELLLAVLLFIYIYKGKMSNFFLDFLIKYKVLIFFLLWVTISFFVNVFWNYDYPLKKIPSRLSPTIDSLLRLIYVGLNICAFFISVNLFSKRLDLLKYWVYGAVIVAIYAWYLSISSKLNIPYIKLFGMDEDPQMINGFIRCGTFKEGNFFGLFLLLSAIISFNLKKTKIGVFLMLTIITTFSTITIISAIVFLVFIFRRIFLRKKFFYSFLAIFPILVFGAIYVINTPYFKSNVISKINKPSNILENNFSKVDRALTARIAYFQGINNPVFGVGPYNYGFHYDQYNDSKEFILDHSVWSLKFFRRDNLRAIPNNVYLEVFSEYGIVGFLLFILFIVKILIISFKNKNDIITGGIIAMLISFNAFPSFIMLFIWVFFAIPVAINYKNKIINE